MNFIQRTPPSRIAHRFNFPKTSFFKTTQPLFLIDHFHSNSFAIDASRNSKDVPDQKTFAQKKSWKPYRGRVIDKFDSNRSNAPSTPTIRSKFTKRQIPPSHADSDKDSLLKGKEVEKLSRVKVQTIRFLSPHLSHAHLRRCYRQTYDSFTSIIHSSFVPKSLTAVLDGMRDHSELWSGDGTKLMYFEVVKICGRVETLLASHYEQEVKVKTKMGGLNPINRDSRYRFVVGDVVLRSAVE